MENFSVKLVLYCAWSAFSVACCKYLISVYPKRRKIFFTQKKPVMFELFTSCKPSESLKGDPLFQRFVMIPSPEQNRCEITGTIILNKQLNEWSFISAETLHYAGRNTGWGIFTSLISRSFRSDRRKFYFWKKKKLKCVSQRTHLPVKWVVCIFWCHLCWLLCWPFRKHTNPIKGSDVLLVNIAVISVSGISYPGGEGGGSFRLTLAINRKHEIETQTKSLFSLRPV